MLGTWQVHHRNDMATVFEASYTELKQMEERLERLREYACHKFECARIKDAAAKCDCGLAELLA